MSQSARKFIAILLALWLPLFSGSVLAASVSMQYHSGQHQSGQMDSVQSHDDAHDDVGQFVAMQHGDSCEQQFADSSDTQHHAASHDHHDKKCTACGVCHLACSGYLAVSDLSGLTQHQPEATVAVYLLSFNSTTSLPLLPPPLARV